MTEKKIISDKSVLFAAQEPTLHYVKVAPESDEYLKVWIKEPTWIEVDRAVNTLMKIDAQLKIWILTLMVCSNIWLRTLLLRLNLNFRQLIF